ncbi:hypothetical protein BKN38_03250 [Helicobacter sp. CLO-3]|uniref:TonB-dependent receptor n=1 Tax=unclassified Helicobacter TaxID=2593540 RepID=UPI0008059683|nr:MULTISPECIES: TonB-dependent receptor [unclassified Helicobacter]OBV29305.1 hypothetical protein BA723_06165 [Helicobacter sp. CLO-3]OHU84479.1 hypothetical protein BKN38_03250 [Helicobacter sp. CLO-3]
MNPTNRAHRANIHAKILPLIAIAALAASPQSLLSALESSNAESSPSTTPESAQNAESGNADSSAESAPAQKSITESSQTITQNTLEKVVTIASRVQTPIEQAPGNTSVVEQKDIARRPNYRFTDTIRGLSGVLQPKGRGMETFDSVTIRGIPNGALIMLDGIIMNDINSNTKMLTSMRAHDLDRVEITRGASSALYGAGGLSGAVNFITRMPEKLEVYGSVGYGNPFADENAPTNYTQWYLSAGDAFLDKRLRVKATYGGQFSSGYAADNAWISTDNATNGLGGAATSTNGAPIGAIPSQNASGQDIYIIGDMGRQRFATHNARIKGELDIGSNGMLDAWVQYSSYNYIHHRQKSFLRDSVGGVYWGDATSGDSDTAGSGTAPYAFVGGMGNEIYHQVISALGYRHFFGDNEWRTTFSYMYGNDLWGGPGAGASPSGGAGSATNHLYHQAIFESNFNYAINEKHSLLFGIQERFSGYMQNAYALSDWRDFSTQGAQTDKITSNQNFFGIFVNYSAVWSRFFSTTIGGRWDLWQDFGYSRRASTSASNVASPGNTAHNQFSPKASINFTPFSAKWGKTIVKISGGSSFRAPTFNQKYRQYARNDGVTFAGNPNLKPEVLYSYDVGVEQSFLQNSAFGGVVKAYYFDSFFDNAITALTSGYENAQKARINGVELAYNQTFWRYFGIMASYTYYNAKLTQDLGAIKAGNRLPSVPEHSAYAQVYYDDSKLFGSIGIEYASKQYKSLDNATQSVWGVYSSMDAYRLLDARVGYRFKHYEASLNLTNLLNEQYYAYYKAPGRAFFFELAARI